MQSVGLLVRLEGSMSSVLVCAKVFDLRGGTRAHQFQNQLAPRSATVAASLLSAMKVDIRPSRSRCLQEG